MGFNKLIGPSRKADQAALGTIGLPPRQDGSAPTAAAPPVCSALGNLLKSINWLSSLVLVSEYHQTRFPTKIPF